MDLKNLSTQEKSLALAGFFIIVLIFVGLFLGYNFSKISKDGVQCLDAPLVYAERRMQEDHGNLFDCACVDAELIQELYYYDFNSS